MPSSKKEKNLGRACAEELPHTNQIAALQGAVAPIGAVSGAATGVKMWSNGQDTFWGRLNGQAVRWAIARVLVKVKRRD